MGLEVFLHLTSAVELIGGGEVTALHLAEDGAGVDHAALGEVEVDSCTQEFLSEQGNVEIVRVETREVRTGELLCQFLGQMLERRLVLHVVVRDARQLGDDGLDGLLRVDEMVATLFAAVRKHLNI